MSADRTIVVSRVIEAPRRLVFEAFTDVRHLAAWWGPNGFRTTTSAFEFRPGGVWEFVMHGPDGVDYPNRIVWSEIVRPERLVYSHAESENDPDGFVTTITFVEKDETTEITLSALFKTREQRDFKVKHVGALEGGKQTLGRLADYVATRIEQEGLGAK